jgi:hypothetical protein
MLHGVCAGPHDECLDTLGPVLPLLSCCNHDTNNSNTCIHPVMKLVHSLGDEAAGPGGVSLASLVAGALWELSVGLIRGNFLHRTNTRASVDMLARFGGSCFQAGLSMPTDELDV